MHFKYKMHFENSKYFFTKPLQLVLIKKLTKNYKHIFEIFPKSDFTEIKM